MAVNDYGIEIQKEPEMVMIPIADYEAEKMRLHELESENKKLEDYIDAYQKSEAINIAKLDEKDERIKELELALSNSREHEKALRKCFDNHRQRIKELEAAISKMETTQKWISVKDVLPQWGKLVKIKFKDGKEDERRFSADYKWVSKGMQTCESVNVTHWMPLPSAPTTEEKL